MPVIYEPQGRAQEYSELAINLYTGCSHRCQYCYVPQALRTNLEAWSTHPQPRKKILQTLSAEARKMSGCTKEVLLSFSSDPYQSDEAAAVTREALLILEANYFQSVQVLTKAGHRAKRDFDIFERNPCFWKFGSSISFLSESLRERWEPGAPSIASRIAAVQEAYQRGVYTWVSVEPVVDHEEALQVIAALRPFTNLFKIGKLNHMQPDTPIDWAAFLRDVRAVLGDHPHIIKKDLLVYEHSEN